MANPYGQASLDLGLDGSAGDALNEQMTEEEKLRRKQRGMMATGQADQSGANAMGMAAMNLLGAFRG